MGSFQLFFIYSISTGGAMCVRCFHLQLRSPHVLQVHTEGLDKCYTSEEAARETCPSVEDIRGGKPSRHSLQIMLYS